MIVIKVRKWISSYKSASAAGLPFLMESNLKIRMNMNLEKGSSYPIHPEILGTLIFVLVYKQARFSIVVRHSAFYFQTEGRK